jgi:exodeoxyribonuclease VII large subunit
LQSRAALQTLALSPVFVEFPQKIKDWYYEVEDLQMRMEDAFAEKLKEKNKRLEKVISQLSPLRLASKVANGQKRLAVLRERQIAAIRKAVDAKDESLKIGMASLDALSPLSVLRRGFSIAEKESGEILRDAESVKTGETVKIRLAKGMVEAKVTKSER